ncbi:MAG: hypothetical protein R2744_13505 [Bacteroidales bacterium]
MYRSAYPFSNFITTNDSYVTPVPDPRLAKAGSDVISADINRSRDFVEVDNR